jgi:hypothetical protein
MRLSIFDENIYVVNLSTVNILNIFTIQLSWTLYYIKLQAKGFSGLWIFFLIATIN